jgi:uncharacterized protein
MDYLSLIQKYFPLETHAKAQRLYLIHVTLVTKKALEIAQKFSLSAEELQFLEEASMLHDIGICRVNAPDIGCTGKLPYISHIVEGGKILRDEGYPEHAQVAETHTGVGILASDIREHKLALPEKDWMPQTNCAEIIAFADNFFSKRPKEIWKEKTLDEVRSEIGQYGSWHAEQLEQQIKKFLV